MRKLVSIALLWAALILFSVDAGAANRYRLLQIGDLPVNGVGNTYVTDINQFGQVVGYTSTATGALEAFVWRHGHRRVLGAMHVSDITAAINDRGDIAVLLFNPNSGVAIAPNDPLRPHVKLDTALFIVNDGKIIAKGWDSRGSASVP